MISVPLERDNVVYWKTKRKIKDDLQCPASYTVRRSYVEDVYNGSRVPECSQALHDCLLALGHMCALRCRL